MIDVEGTYAEAILAGHVGYRRIIGKTELTAFEKLARRERILTVTLSSISDFAYIYDREGRFLFANQPLLNLWGLTLEEAVGKNFFDLGYPDELAARLQAQIEEVFQTKTVVTGETPYTSPIGLEGFYEYIFSPVTGLDGAVEFVVGSTRDITARKHAEEATARSLRRLNEAQRIGLIGDWDHDFVKGAITWSPQMFELLDCDPQPGPPSDFAMAAAPHDARDRRLVNEKTARAIESGAAQECEVHSRRQHGEKILQFRLLPRKDDAGRVTGLHGTVQDISLRKRGENAIRDRARQQEFIATLGHTALGNAPLDLVFAEAASAVAKGLDVEFSEVVQLMSADGSFVVKAGQGWDRDLSRAYDDPRVTRVLALGKPVIIDDFACQPQASSAELLRAHGIASGVSLPILCHDRNWGVLGAYSRQAHRFSTENLDFLRSIANILAMAVDRERRDAQLTHLAHYDPLTALANRALLNDRMEAAVARARAAGTRLALLYLDLDKFKNVNDSFGHGAGDLLLQEVARRIAGTMRASDTLSRQGGDEFLILLPEINGDDDAAQVAEKMFRAMDEPVNIGNVELLVTGSIGIACFPENGKDAEKLLCSADAAMYSAKEAGRNCYRFYSEDMNTRARGRLLLESDLSRAIARNELFLQFQPQVAMDSGAITGVEALVRWRHPSLGVVMPGRFISVAEESGLIVSIGSWVLEAACRQQAQWMREGIGCGRMAINVSAIQFCQPGFVAIVRNILERSGLEPSHLEIELTESVVMEGVESVREKLASLNKLGVRFAIDDFGTGQSNLSYLKQFPLHQLKIDRSFVSGLPADKENGALAQAVISMGHALGLNVIAEGIETREQAEYLRLMGCEEAQGFYYSRPLSPEDCAEFFRTGYTTGF